MKLKELFEQSEDEVLKLKADNPGGSWLEGKRSWSIKQGANDYGAPSTFGSITGSWTRSVLLPVAVVSRLQGLRGEHLDRHTRKTDLDWLSNEMGTHNRLPLTDSGKQYAPFINVYQDGTPYINEGNHRIKAAKQLGWKYIPIQMYYYNGGEEENGPLTPAKVKEYDAMGHAEGYSVSQFAGKSKD